ncbi:hypothetical protein C3B58_15560 [Lactonifactor longoviformis]|uniref:Minor capsid protein n=1 Tax=Lactonifactor longoviformis DSM 17459 TaxID=1122155 RepID=A0A1M4TQI4_9CLOT|nr:hypothetical protein [Lactonifactor longoviformis]POP31634.1 hypothetical protein C3B58_15560 [Lactonifactor longoviformis]SHE46770.1 hypothetical protein SAMN02745158_00546 [Lactonifactor longoviformis DSM 17459]
MEPQVEIINLVKSTVESGCDLPTVISLEGLSADGGLYVQFGEGYQEDIYYDKSRIIVLPIIFLCKDTSQIICIEQLSKICNFLQNMSEYPEMESAVWLDAQTVKEPNKLDIKEEPLCVYSCTVNIRIFNKK